MTQQLPDVNTLHDQDEMNVAVVAHIRWDDFIGMKLDAGKVAEARINNMDA